MNRIALQWTVGILILASLITKAQTEPMYYTDSKVERHYVSFGLNYDPMYTGRRLFTIGSSDVNSQYNSDDYPASGGFGYSWGGYVNFNINSNMRLGVGAGQTSISYTLENYSYYTGLDTVSLGLKVNGIYNTFPLRVGFATHMNDSYSLEIWIPIAYNKLVSYTEEASLNGLLQSEDMSALANQGIWSVAIQVGGAFHITDKFAVIASLQFRYFTKAMIDKPNRPTETPYGAGLSLGLRYSL